jgi:hypothetical protein
MNLEIGYKRYNPRYLARFESRFAYAFKLTFNVSNIELDNEVKSFQNY